MIYFVFYGNSNSYTCGGTFSDLSQAQAAFDWFKTLNGITYAQILSISADTVSSWGTPPA